MFKVILLQKIATGSGFAGDTFRIIAPAGIQTSAMMRCRVPEDFDVARDGIEVSAYNVTVDNERKVVIRRYVFSGAQRIAKAEDWHAMPIFDATSALSPASAAREEIKQATAERVQRAANFLAELPAATDEQVVRLAAVTPADVTAARALLAKGAGALAKAAAVAAAGGRKANA